MFRFTSIILLTGFIFIASGVDAQVVSFTQLTFDENMTGYAEWSPDGSYIIFTSDDMSDDVEGESVSYLSRRW